MKNKRENHGEIDNRQAQSEFGNWGYDEYQASWGDQTSDVRYAGGAIDPQLI